MIPARRSSVRLVDLADDHGAASTDRLAPGVVLTTFTGRVPASWVDTIVQPIEREVIDGPRLNFFVDLEVVDSFPASLRVRGIELFLEHRRKVASLSVLGGSRLVQTTVSVANLALGGVVASYRDRGSFETAVEAALLRTRRR